MATPIEIKRAQAELARVSSAKLDLELKIEERMEEIKRIEDHIKVQEAKELELLQRIEDLKAEKC
jgi:hypothetical protein